MDEKFDTFIINMTTIKQHEMKRFPLLNVFATLILLSLFSSSMSQPAQGWKADPATVERLSKSQPDINYQEDIVPHFKLPEVLTDSKGRRIKNSYSWESERRQEVLELFRQNVYGRVPSTPYTKDFRVVNEDRNAIGGAATLKQVEIMIKSDGRELAIHLTLFIPNNASHPVPVFLLINNRDPENTDPARQVRSEFWPVEEVIARGYAISAFYNDDVDPDNFDDFRNGIHGILDRGERSDDSWGTLAAWAWGASRCMDYFETDRDIDSRKVAVVGHSRGGKTALWAAAEDKRFAMAVANESGCGGAALARRKYGETVARINKVFPHWFCLNYRKWNNNEDAMPVDMHMLISLIAPRAVYITSADQDLWADPRGSYLSLFNSMPVYRLYYPDMTLPRQMPPLNSPVISGKAAYHIRDGVHNLLLKDWNWFMDFSDKTLK
ncbi:MAG TPA: prolyl oligopeptidase family serine peptidase [Bacteroidales bacterium]|jgi:pimeloyl-ACP methyl ester carboxylesterase|nr:prolyl oligopeptidase family serine peptidase [Bacteroidales bacterium]